MANLETMFVASLSVTYAIWLSSIRKGMEILNATNSSHKIFVNVTDSTVLFQIFWQLGMLNKC